jgi:aconitate hydratase
MTTHNDVFGARATLQLAGDTIIYYRLGSLARKGVQGLDRLPYTVKILLENALRHAGSELVNEEEVLSLAGWVPGKAAQSEAEYHSCLLASCCRTLPACLPWLTLRQCARLWLA